MGETEKKISKYIITFDKCYQGKEQIAVIADKSSGHSDQERPMWLECGLLG